jgi:hypothetical protein
VSASDKLFYWVFQLAPDRILQLQRDLPADATYSFNAPVLKEREYRLDGLFSPREQRPDRPVVILEAQMAPDSGFLRRLYAESARLLQQDSSIQHWRVVVLCPRRDMGFGDPTAVAEFIERPGPCCAAWPSCWKARTSCLRRPHRSAPPLPAPLKPPEPSM